MLPNFNTSNLTKLFKRITWKKQRNCSTHLYETLREHISCRLKDMQAVSFTTDMWTSDVCPMSLLSLHNWWTQYQCQHLPFKCGAGPHCWDCVWFFHTLLLNKSIVKLLMCLVSSDFNLPIHQTRVNSRINCLAEKNWQFFLRCNPHTQLCCSSHKCMFLTDGAPFKKGNKKGLGLCSTIRCIAKKHC